MEKNAKIYVAGHKGLVGSAIVRKLKSLGYENILTKSSKECDLRDYQQVKQLFTAEKPEYVFLAAAKVGGIHANSTYPAQFIFDNLSIAMNVIDNAYHHQTKRLLFLGSSCIYPRDCPQPIQEKYLLTGELEKTNESYAIAKIAGLKMCEAYNRQYGTHYLSVMPTNLYGPNDNYDLENSHVMPALIRKFHEAKMAHKPYVEVWGTGEPRREFLHVDDLADACVFLMDHNEEELVNVGCGQDLTIKELAEMIQKIIGYQGQIKFNSARPDGTIKKLLDVSRLGSLGWKPHINLRDGIQNTYQMYLKQIEEN